MKIQIINPIEYPNWNDQVAELPGATIFHTSNWAKVLGDSYDYKPRYFCTLNQGKLQNVIPVMEINSFITGKRGVSLPFSDHVDPLVRDKGIFEEILAAIISFGRNNGWRTITFHGVNDFLQPEPSYTSYVNSYVDLDGSPNSLFKKFKSSTRRNIRKAKKNGLTTKIVQSKEGIEAFYLLNCLSRREHGLPPQPFSFFERIHETVCAKGNGFVCLSLNNDEPIAGVFFLHFNQKSIYKYGASDKRFLHLRPNNLCMWEAIKRCSENKSKSLDLGRSDLDHQGLLQFKRSWNSKEKILHYYRYDLRQNRFLNKKPAVKSSYSVFKQLPVPILKIIGQAVYRHVG